MIDDVRLVVRDSDKSAEIRVRHPTVDLGAGDDRYLHPPDEADAPAEVRDDIAVDERAELKDVDALEEEQPLFRKQQGKPREVRLACVHLCFREIGVQRQRRGDVGSKTLGNIETRAE